ncbi:hypothetical protein ABZ572_35050 [Streptomyces sp. NPDC018338]|uniref:hypothetical protein n=1 Tax=Streptomyces sp. NPDC018338 TaxID=3157192 RepID=UPI0033F1E354
MADRPFSAGFLCHNGERLYSLMRTGTTNPPITEPTGVDKAGHAQTIALVTVDRTVEYRDLTTATSRWTRAVDRQVAPHPDPARNDVIDDSTSPAAP